MFQGQILPYLILTRRGTVIARQPFGVFIAIDGAPTALGLAEITSMPREVVLPAIGTTVAGEVIWHAEHNHQIKLRLLTNVQPDLATADPHVNE
jgi:hypothetical protein